MEKRYRVVFLGLVKSEDYFKDGMSRLGVSPTQVERIIGKAPVILKEDMPIGTARRYADAVMEAGGSVNIQEYRVFEDDPEKKGGPYKIRPLGSFTMCPQCGKKQLKAEQCVKCGFVFSKKSQG